MAKSQKPEKKIGGPFLAAAVFCESVLEDKNGKISALGILDTCNVWVSPDAPPNVPSKDFPIMITPNFLIVFRTGDAPGKHRLRLVIESPEGKRTKILEQDIELFPLPHGGCNVKTQSVMNVSSTGVFWIDVVLDSKRLTRMPLNVSVERLPSQTTGGEKGRAKKG